MESCTSDSPSVMIVLDIINAIVSVVYLAKLMVLDVDQPASPFPFLFFDYFPQTLPAHCSMIDVVMKVTYDMVPLVVFLALVAAAIGVYMFHAGKSVCISQYMQSRGRVLIFLEV